MIGFKKLLARFLFRRKLLSPELYTGRLVQAQTRPEPENISRNTVRTRKLFLGPNHARKNPKVKLGLKNLAILPSYFDYIFEHLRQKAGLRPELSPKFLSTFGPKPT